MTGPARRRGRHSALNDKQVENLRRMYANGTPPRQLAVLFSVSKRTVHRALKAAYVPQSERAA